MREDTRFGDITVRHRTGQRAGPSVNGKGAHYQRSTLVGQLAAADLQTGMLLTSRSVTGEQVPPRGTALVGVLVKYGQAPVTPLSPQDQVLLVPADQQAAATAAGAADAKPVQAEVYTVGATDANGTRTVDVLVPQASAAQTAAAAAAGRLAIVLVPRS